MDDALRQFQVALTVVQQRRWLGVAVAWVVAILAAGAVVVMQDRYQASAKVFVDTQTVLKPLMTGLAFQPDVDQQVGILAKTLISRPNMERLIASPRIGFQNRSERDKAKIIDRFLTDIKMVPAGNANLFAITYKDINPQRAQNVVEDLVALFVSSGILDKRRDSEQARMFLDDQIKVYEAKLSDAENRVKDFKMKNFGLTGTSDKDFFARMSTATDQLNRMRVELQAAEQSRDALRRELANEDPTIPVEALGPNMGVPLTETETRLDAQKRILDDLQRRYTDDHPDVVAVKRTIAQLEQQRKADAQAKALAGGKSHPAPTSPVFQKIRVSLAEAEAKVASLRGQVGAEQALLAESRSLAGRMPEIEAQMAQLNRDYEVVRKNYEQLVTRRESASLGEQIDRTTQVAEFRVVEPPRVSPTPAPPSRVIVAVIGMVLAVIAGVGASFGISLLMGTVNDTRQLKEISGRPVLGSVSMVIGPVLRRSVDRSNRLFLIHVAVFFIANIAWVIAVSQHVLP